MSIRIVAEDFKDAYHKLNREFIFGKPLDYERSGVTAHHQCNQIYIKHADCDLALDQFGYARAKWNMLTKLYFDAEAFGLMIARLQHYNERRKGKYMPHIALSFKERENRSGACLLALSIGFVKSRGWEVEVTTRASEVSTRLPADFLFVYKIIEELGKYLKFNPHDVAVIWHGASMYQSILSAPLFLVMDGEEQWMIDNEDFEHFKYEDHWKYSVLRRYYKCYVADAYQSYKSQRRAVAAYDKIKDNDYQIYPDTIALPPYTIHNGSVEEEDDLGIFKVGGFK